MPYNRIMETIKGLLRISGIPILIASLCCLTPVVLVALGLASASFAASLATTLYGTYKWYFRSAGIILLGISLVAYFRRQKGICTIDEAVRRKNEIINMTALAIIAGILGYLFFLYVAVEYAGIALDIWQ